MTVYLAWPAGRSAGGQNPFDGGHIAAPRLGLRAERSPALRGEPVVAGAAVVLRRAPFGADPPLELEPLERGVERPLVDVEHAARELLDALADPPAMHRLQRE